jgi:hypothetical protein
LEVEVAGPLPETVQSYKHGRVLLHFFACTPRDAAQPPRAPFQWHERRRLGELDFPAGNRQIIQLLTSMPSSCSP